MSSHIVLNGNEALSIAGMMKAKRFIGVAGTFDSLNADDMRRELIKVQNTLIEKGYADLSFDGFFSVKEEVREMIRDCVFCNTYAVLEKKGLMEIESCYRYYIGQNGLVKVSDDKGGYRFERTVNTELSSAMIGSFVWEENAQKEETVYLDPFLLEDIKENESHEKERKQLLMEGCSEEMADLLIDGFKGKAQRFSFSVMDLTDEAADKNVSIIGIHSKQGTILLTEKEVDYIDKIEISFIGNKALRDMVKRALQEFEIWEEEQFI